MVMEDRDMNIGNVIMTKSKELGLTQQALADKLGVSFQAVSKWEKGISVPDIQLLMKLSEILGVSVNDLLGVNVNESNHEKRLEILENELSKLKQQIDSNINSASRIKRNVLLTFGLILLFAIVFSILGIWSDMFYEFGKNLYHIVNN